MAVRVTVNHERIARRCSIASSDETVSALIVFSKELLIDHFLHQQTVDLAHLKFHGVTRLPKGLGKDPARLVKTITGKILRKAKLGSAALRVLQPSHFRQIQAYVQHLRNGKEYSVTESKAREVVALWETITKSYSGSAVESKVMGAVRVE